MSIFTDIYIPYVCDLLGPYISLVKNSIEPIYGYYLSYKPITLPCTLFYVHWNKIYSLSFMGDVCNEVYEHIWQLSEL